MQSTWDMAKSHVERMRSIGKGDPEIVEGLHDAGWSDAHIAQLSALLAVPLSVQAAGRFPQPSEEEKVTVEPEPRVSQGWIPLSFDGDKQLYSPSGEFGLSSAVDVAGSSGAYVIVLTRNGRVLWEFRIGRDCPLEGAVTNSGYAAVCADTPTDSLTGDLYVIGPTGDEIIKKRLSACLSQCGLCEDGSLAWCTTLCNPDKDLHSNKLIVFSIEPPRQLFAADQPFGRIRQVWRPSAEIVVSTEENLQYRYSAEGELLNECELVEEERAARLSAAIRTGDGYAVLRVAEERLSLAAPTEMGPDDREVVRQLLERVTQCQVSSNAKARTHKCLAEIALACGDKPVAIAHYKTAIQLNPRIGLKKLLQSLESEPPGR